MAGDISLKRCIVDIFESMDFSKRVTDLTLARDWLNNHKKIDCWISGKYFKQKSVQYNLVQSLEDGSLCEVADGSCSVDVAVDSSIKAQNKWEALSSHEKSSLLYRLSKELATRSELFSQLNSFSLQKNEFSLFVDYFNYYSDWATLLEDYKRWKPLGVVVVIVNDMAPAHTLAMIVAPALASGCSVIIKPANKAPFIPYLLAELCTQIGFPDGLINVIPGSEKTTEALLTRKINKAVFVGSNTITHNIIQLSVTKAYSFLNFNQTSAIILDLCDLDAAVDKIFSETWNINHYQNWGVSTIVVHEAVSKQFTDKLKLRIKKVMPGSEIPLIFKDRAMIAKVNKVITDARNIGAVVESNFASDDIWSPTIIFDYQSPDIEPGLPIVTILTCRTVKEAVALVNNSKYCVATSVWSEVFSQALEASFMLKSNTVWVNSHGLSEASIPFQPLYGGGEGNFGGKDGLLEYMHCRLEDHADHSNKVLVESDTIFTKSTISKAVEVMRSSLLKWQNDKNKKKYLCDIAEALEKDYLQLSHLVQYWAASSSKIFVRAQQSVSQELLVTQTKQPVGVIAIFITEVTDVVRLFVSFVTPAIALGNAVVLVATEENAPLLKPVVQLFTKSLPPNLLTIFSGPKVARYLAGNPNVDALWLCSEAHVANDFLLSTKQDLCKTFKHLWVTPNITSKDLDLFAKQCLNNKILWLTKVSQFA